MAPRKESSETSSEKRPWTVSELTRAVKRLLETEIGEVEVEGEIGNWTLSARGHAYFNLKDEGAVLSCVLFNAARARLAFEPREGLQVAAVGRISVYETRGQYQLIVSSLRETGLGDLYRRFLEIKDRLEKEGLFAPERKRRLPALPQRIGVVTSPTGAVLRDIIHVIRRRFRGVELVIAPTLVQGDEAPPRIVRAIEQLNVLSWLSETRGEPPIGVMIVGRGGGSLEDLWAFNDERVARAIAASRIPVVSAVGHETDFTIADFVADVRAPTPSAAAEIVVGEARVLAEQVTRLKMALARQLAQLVRTRRLELGRLMGSWGLRQPLDLVRQAIQRLDDLSTRGETALQSRMRDARGRVEGLSGRLGALNPTAVLARGYSIVSRARDGRVVTRENQVRVSDHVRVQLSEGELRAAVLPRGEDFLDGVETKE